MCEEWSGLVPSFWQGVVSKRLVRRFGLGNEVDVCFSTSFRPHNLADLLCAKTIDHKHTWQTANYDQTQKQNIPINRIGAGKHIFWSIVWQVHTTTWKCRNDRSLRRIISMINNTSSIHSSPCSFFCLSAADRLGFHINVNHSCHYLWEYWRQDSRK